MVLCPVGFGDEHFPLSGTVNHGPVNVRSGANTNFDIVTKLEQGAKIVLLGKSYEWYKIQLPALANAYVRADYIKEVGNHGGEIIGNKVNVRSKPDSNAAILGQLVRGDLVKLTQKKADWWQVEPPSGTFAWVHGSFIDVSLSVLPADAIRKPLKAQDVVPLATVKIEKPLPPVFHAQGILKLLADSVLTNIHYKIVSQGQTLCYLEDAKGIEKFQDVTVSIDGIKDDSVGMLSAPVVTISKIALVL